MIKSTITKGDISSIFTFIRTLSRLGKGGKITLENLKVGLLKSKIDLSPEALGKLGNLFATAEVGIINTQEFIQTIIGEMDQTRSELVEKVFEKIDTDNDGHITTQEMIAGFDAKKNSDVIAKKKTEKQILAQFLDAIDIFFGVIVCLL